MKNLEYYSRTFTALANLRQFCPMPGSPFVFGGGVTTNYTGPAVCDPMDFFTLNVEVPYADLAFKKASYRTLQCSVLRAQLGGYELYQTLQYIWQGVVADFQLANLADPNLYAETNLNPGKNESQGNLAWSNMHHYEVLLIDDNAPNIDKWWGDDDMGKYGYFNPMVDNLKKVMPMVWLNSVWNEIPNDYANANSWSCFLFPNLYGIIRGVGKLVPPPLVYSGTYSGVYPPA